MDRPVVETRSAPARPPAVSRSAKRILSRASRQVKIVEFRSGEAVERHPELSLIISDGWQVEIAVPHVTEQNELKLRVELVRREITEVAAGE